MSCVLLLNVHVLRVLAVVIGFNQVEYTIDEGAGTVRLLVGVQDGNIPEGESRMITLTSFDGTAQCMLELTVLLFSFSGRILSDIYNSYAAYCLVSIAKLTTYYPTFSSILVETLCTVCTLVPQLPLTTTGRSMNLLHSFGESTVNLSLFSLEMIPQ